jgi:hypothetical protein
MGKVWPQVRCGRNKSCLDLILYPRDLTRTAMKEIAMIVPAILGNATDRDERDPRPDYAARRWNAIQDASGHVLVSRERATGAAAESEQLLTAVRIVLGRTDSYISCFCPGPCCHQPSERLADWPIGDWSISFPPHRIWRPRTWRKKTREATVGDNQNSMTAGP